MPLNYKGIRPLTSLTRNPISVIKTPRRESQNIGDKSVSAWFSINKIRFLAKTSQKNKKTRLTTTKSMKTALQPLLLNSQCPGYTTDLEWEKNDPPKVDHMNSGTPLVLKLKKHTIKLYKTMDKVDKNAAQIFNE